MGRRSSSGGMRGAITLASAVFEQMRTDIISGALQPNTKLRIESLQSRYKTGSSPIREALNRLSSEDLVIQRDQRGFYVAPVSLEEFLDLTFTRLSVYETAIRDSIANRSEESEERIVLAMHRMSRAKWVIDGDLMRPDPESHKAHRELHRALIGACGSRRLLDFADSLFDQADRYRFLAQHYPDATKRDSNAEHRAIVEATLARDTATALRLTREHLLLTTEFVKKQFETVQQTRKPPQRSRTSARQLAAKTS
jgi:DNA-binding GntR family transcriptional regulator